jgi:hypothetical protein
MSQFGGPSEKANTRLGESVDALDFEFLLVRPSLSLSLSRSLSRSLSLSRYLSSRVSDSPYEENWEKERSVSPFS